MIRYIIMYFFCVVACSCERREVPDPGSSDKSDDLNKHNYQGRDLEKIPKLKEIEAIYSIREAAIGQSWSKQVWVIRFGEPTITKDFENGKVVIRYIPKYLSHEAPSDFFISNATVILVDDATVSVSFGHTKL